MKKKYARALRSTRDRRRTMRTVHAAIATIAILLGVTGPLAGSASAAWSPPTYVRSVGARGAAGVYAWGMAYNSFSDEILVGDFWNYQVRRYSRSGVLLGSFFRPKSQLKGNPYQLAVDPRNGDIYVPEISDNDAGWIVRYDKQGTLLGAFDVRTRYNAWITIDKNGLLYVADSHYWNNAGDPSKVKVFDLNNNAAQVRSWGSWGIGPGQFGNIHGIGVSNDGRVFVADTDNRRVHVFSTNGTWLYDFGTMGTGVGEFTGDIRGLAVDQTAGIVYVVDASAGEVEAFALDGTPLRHWGELGHGQGQFSDGGRGVAVGAAGHVLVSDYGNFRFFDYLSDGTLVGTYPSPPSPAGRGQTLFLRDVAVDSAGNIWTSDARNNGFKKFASDGTFIDQWGERASDPPYGFSYPRGIGVDPASQDVWVIDTRAHIIRVYDNNGGYIRTIGSGIDSTGVGSFRWPIDIAFNAGKAYVADYVGRILKVIDVASGTEIAALAAPSGSTFNGVGVDPASGDLFITDGARNRVWKYRVGLVPVTSWGSSGTGLGQFNTPGDADVINGLLYVTDVNNRRVQVFNLSGSTVGAFGSGGSLPGRFSQPFGLTHDAAGNIYVADADNDRVQVFSHSVTPVTGDSVLPDVAITAPAASASVPLASVDITGFADDNMGVALVQVAVQDSATSLWWNAKDSTWNGSEMWNQAIGWGADTHHLDYRFTFVGELDGHRYTVKSQVVDLAGNARTVKSVFAVGAADVSPPSTAITTPVIGSNQVTGGSLPIAGTASDPSGVASVTIAILDKNQPNTWWDSATNSWKVGQRWITTSLGTPGGTSTGWSYGWPSPPKGSYWVVARSADTAGNIDESRPYTTFNVVLPGDSTAPTASITAPTKGSTVPAAGGVTVSGPAADDSSGVAGVQVAILDRNNPNMWWDGSTNTWKSGLRWNPATVAAPGSTSTSWSYLFQGAATGGSYYTTIRTTDANGNADESRPNIAFLTS